MQFFSCLLSPPGTSECHTTTFFLLMLDRISGLEGKCCPCRCCVACRCSPYIYGIMARRLGGHGLSLFRSIRCSHWRSRPKFGAHDDEKARYNECALTGGFCSVHHPTMRANSNLNPTRIHIKCIGRSTLCNGLGVGKRRAAQKYQSWHASTMGEPAPLKA